MVEIKRGMVNVHESSDANTMNELVGRLYPGKPGKILVDEAAPKKPEWRPGAFRDPMPAYGMHFRPSDSLFQTRLEVIRTPPVGNPASEAWKAAENKFHAYIESSVVPLAHAPRMVQAYFLRLAGGK